MVKCIREENGKKLVLEEFEGCPIHLEEERDDAIIVSLEYRNYILKVEFSKSGEDKIVETNMKPTQLNYNYKCVLTRKDACFRNLEKHKTNLSIDEFLSVAQQFNEEFKEEIEKEKEEYLMREKVNGGL